MNGQGAAALTFLDLETSGLNPQKNKIIEVAMICRRSQGERQVVQELVNPGVPLEPFITQLTGISDEMLKSAPRIDTLSEALQERLEGSWLIAHNANFDVSFLEEELGIRLPRRRVVDTIELAKILYPRLKSYSLRSLVRSFGLPVSPCHRLWGIRRLWRPCLPTLCAGARLFPRAFGTDSASFGPGGAGLYHLFWKSTGERSFCGRSSLGGACKKEKQMPPPDPLAFGICLQRRRPPDGRQRQRPENFGAPKSW